ncbi:MAG: heavy-metal-associated domain-containing protein [Egibacteraceae bacterium]
MRANGSEEDEIVTERTFRVQDIHCDGCEHAISKALGRLEGVQRVEPNHRSNEVRVAFDEQQVVADEIATRLHDAGYPVVG